MRMNPIDLILSLSITLNIINLTPKLIQLITDNVMFLQIAMN